MADVRMSMEEYLALLNGTPSANAPMPAPVSEQEKPKRRRRNAYHRFSKNFAFRSKRKNERSQDYLAARAKAVGRAWRRSKK